MYPIRPNNYGCRLSFGRRQFLRTYCFQYVRSCNSNFRSLLLPMYKPPSTSTSNVHNVSECLEHEQSVNPYSGQSCLSPQAGTPLILRMQKNIDMSLKI